MKTFQDALDYLYSFVSYEKNTNWKYTAQTLNLERFRTFLHSIGHPQQRLKAIHAAGSDGKGSVCAMVASVLQHLGYRVGLYTSPHLHSIRERIAINNEWIPEEEFIRLTRHLREAHEQLPLNSKGYATFFELLTAMAFLYFDEQNVDFAVIETGLGGRLDATNVMNPVVTVITHISLEHTDKLGKTLQAISNEKLGITRPHVPIVIAPQVDEVESHIRNQTQTHKSKRIFVQERYHLLGSSWGRRYRRIAYTKPPHKKVIHIFLPMPGEYQINNALTAVATLETLHEVQPLLCFNPTAIAQGLKQTRWPGRFEIIAPKNQAKIILDVAHTELGAIAVRRSLDQLFPKRQRIFVLGFLQDKNIRGIYQELVRQQDQTVITVAPSERGASLGMIQEAIVPANAVAAIENPKEAFYKARQLAGKSHIIIVTGSLYLVGEIRNAIIQAQITDG